MARKKRLILWLRPEAHAFVAALGESELKSGAQVLCEIIEVLRRQSVKGPRDLEASLKRFDRNNRRSNEDVDSSRE